MKRVYFIKPIGMAGPVKIGFSVSPDGRRESLRYWSPFPLEIVAEVEGCGRVERQFHAIFADSHIGHEWFNWSPAMQAVIDAIAGGTFDIATLPDPRQLARRPRDTSYNTPGWRYQLSVRARVSNMRHIPWHERRLVCEMVSGAEGYEGAQLDALRELVEPAVAALAAKKGVAVASDKRPNDPRPNTQVAA